MNTQAGRRLLSSERR